LSTPNVKINYSPIYLEKIVNIQAYMKSYLDVVNDRWQNNLLDAATTAVKTVTKLTQNAHHLKIKSD
jgi:hypothetical protein